MPLKSVKRGLSTLEVRQFAQRVAALATLSQVGRMLHEHGILALAVKGAWLLAEVYPESALRPVTDVDLLVAPRDFERCQAILLNRGATVQDEGDPRQVTVRHPDFLLPIDLHKALFPYGTFSLTAEQMLAVSRASPMIGIRFPHAIQGFAHLIGHFTLSRDIDANLARAADFQYIGEYFKLLPAEVASALERHGLARATRYCFGILESCSIEGGAGFAQQVAQELSRDPFGTWVVELCRASALGDTPQNIRGAFLRCLLQPTVGEICGSVLGRTFSRGKRRVIAAQGNKGTGSGL